MEGEQIETLLGYRLEICLGRFDGAQGRCVGIHRAQGVVSVKLDNEGRERKFLIKEVRKVKK